MIKTGCKIFPVICGNGLDVTKEWDEGNSVVSEFFFFASILNLDLLILMPAAKKLAMKFTHLYKGHCFAQHG